VAGAEAAPATTAAGVTGAVAGVTGAAAAALVAAAAGGSTFAGGVTEATTTGFTSPSRDASRSEVHFDEDPGSRTT